MLPGFSDLIAKYCRDGVLLDTNLLLLLLVGAVDRRLVPKFKRTSQFVERDFDLLVRFVAAFERRSVTAHILTETSNLGGQLGEPLRSRFFRVLFGAIEDLDEIAIPSVEASRSESIAPAIRERLGLTDSILIVTASAPRLVLTDDETLVGELASRRLDAINFDLIRDFGAPA